MTTITEWATRTSAQVAAWRDPRPAPLPTPAGGKYKSEDLTALLGVFEQFEVDFSFADYGREAAERLNLGSPSLAAAARQVLATVDSAIAQALDSGVDGFAAGLLDTHLFGEKGVVVTNHLAGRTLSPSVALGLVNSLPQSALAHLPPTGHQLPITLAGHREPALAVVLGPAVGRSARRWLPLKDMATLTSRYTQLHRQYEIELDNQRELLGLREREARLAAEEHPSRKVARLQEQVACLTAQLERLKTGNNHEVVT